MLSVQFVALVGLAYVLLLFCIAWYGDRRQESSTLFNNGNIVYALSIAVYCSSWTFYGAVGSATSTGIDYLAIYMGPILVFLFGFPVVRKIIMICKQNNITSISDFISSRYGKSREIAVLVTLIAVAGSAPYIALQLKAISMSFETLTSHGGQTSSGGHSLLDDTAFLAGLMLALFTILFGTRHLDATEHHRGMILAISFESIIKLAAILAVGYYSMYLLLDGVSPQNQVQWVGEVFADSQNSWQSFTTKLFLSMAAIILLPRQFHVTIVEARDHEQFRSAMWLMPMYLILTSIIVVPIALSGAVLLPGESADLHVLRLPLYDGNEALALLAFIGGLSAATGMVIVAAIALSTMICNDLVMPYLINRRDLDILNRDDLNGIILLIRRLSILFLMAIAYLYTIQIDSNTGLAGIGLVSFAAIFLFVPSVVCALYWPKANAKGVYYGMIAAFAVWVYCLLIPTILPDDILMRMVEDIGWLHPQALFGFSMDNPLTHGVVWSLILNIGFIVIFSLKSDQSVLDRMQASRFYYTGTQHKAVATGEVGEIEIHPETIRALTERIIGIKHTNALFEQFLGPMSHTKKELTTVDGQFLSQVQKSIAGVIGSSSAQKVVSEVLLGQNEYLEDFTSMVDETSSVLKFNRNLLQTTLENIAQGVSAVDADLNLVVWNDRYMELFEYPDNFIYVGKPIYEILEFNARRGYFKGDQEQEINKRLKFLKRRTPYSYIRHRANGNVIKSTGVPMPGGGFVTTYEDITESVQAATMLRKANEELETRVKERTRELEILTKELEKNTQSKTHFLAAASHDLLQPINAARLFAHGVLENRADTDKVQGLAENIDQSLTTANQLLRALLDISKLDAGGIEPENSVFFLQEVLDDLLLEFKPIAEDKQVSFSVVDTSVVLESDKRLLFSILQNLVANALRYNNPGGRVVIGVRRRGISDGVRNIEIQVADNGDGISVKQQAMIFNEFYQVKGNDKGRGRGLGLGLSIAKRISDLLDARIKLQSRHGIGSSFSVVLPLSEKHVSVDMEKPFLDPIASSDNLSALSVLCLDNDIPVLEAMEMVVSGWGCEFVGLTDYESALQAIKENDFDIALVDYSLDGPETGLDFMRELKEVDDSIPAVLITAEQDQQKRDKALALGYHFMAKPIAPLELKELLAKVFSQR